MTASPAQPADERAPGPPLVAADAHVHFYPCFDAATFLDAAERNLRRAAAGQPGGGDFVGLLLLTEAAGDDWFGALAGRGLPDCPRWSTSATDEPESIALARDDGARLLAVAGRQIVTAEHLEVLALATAASLPDGAPLPETVQAVRAAGGAAVIPWGFGKWLGRRGAVLSRFLERADPATLCLGDNGGRPVFWPRPAHFRAADARGVRVLPGSDPLPFASEADRPGSYGFTCRMPLRRERPAADLRAALARPDFAPRAYGARETPLRFVRNQLAMQARKRRRAA